MRSLTYGFTHAPNYLPRPEAVQFARQQAGHPDVIVAMVAASVLLLVTVAVLAFSYETWKEPLGRRDLLGGLCLGLVVAVFSTGAAQWRLAGLGVLVLGLVAVVMSWAAETPWRGLRGWVARLALVGSVLGFAGIGVGLALGV